MTKKLFALENLSHSYGERVILDIPSLTFEEKRIHAIIGPNGSGKTTLCNILGFILKPNTGKIYYRGNNIYTENGTVERLRKNITMVHQNPFLFNTSVEKNVVYGLRVRKHPRSQWKPKVEECLKLMGMEHLRRQRATRLSGGETQRVAMARALAIDPEVLILDEFTANVDQNYVEIMENVIQDVFDKKDITIFLVTHDENQALRIAHTSTHLMDGRIVESKHLTVKAVQQ